MKSKIDATRSNGKKVSRIHPAVLSKIRELEAEISAKPEKKVELEAEIADRKTNPVYRGTFLAPEVVHQVKAFEARLEELHAKLKVAI